ncbi:phosphate ABC transporter permease PstA [Oscillochloris sp. ZM17-4]|uniref:phosphate ABC transporter permease PstA n=1 Tax=Oscillochloris sp. ZM17-4 TaxID=2866714 RepID=UPI001C72D97D|nr:phosphate ABC transporter permease PstA [Oscillochloris sp. ZM17-4]MBX0327204.1 phosphate ABC transporter permease PstA [Oscillochloris sp. ZM17-4]
MNSDTREILATKDVAWERRIMAARRRATLIDRAMTGVMSLAALFLVIVLSGVIFIILRAGLPAISWTFLTTASSITDPGGGIGPQIWVTMYILVLSLAIVTPIGVGAAIYLSEYARPGPITNAIRFSTEALASVPSVVFGVFGAIVFLTIMNLGFSVLSGSLTLALLNLPLMVRIAEDAIRAVPTAYREASLALGGSRWETIRKAVLPSALPGIITALVLTGGRIIGETAPLILTTGTTISPNAQYSLNPLQTGETLAVHIWVLKIVGVPGLQDAQLVADGSAAVLLLIVLIINVGMAYFTNRLTQRLRGASGAPRAGGSKKG